MRAAVATSTPVTMEDGSVLRVPDHVAKSIIGTTADGYAVVHQDGFTYALTPCCFASATGTESGVACRKCYELVDPGLGAYDEDDVRLWTLYMAARNAAWVPATDAPDTIGGLRVTEQATTAGGVTLFRREDREDWFPNPVGTGFIPVIARGDTASRDHLAAELARERAASRVRPEDYPEGAEDFDLSDAITEAVADAVLIASQGYSKRLGLAEDGDRWQDRVAAVQSDAEKAARAVVGAIRDAHPAEYTEDALANMAHGAALHYARTVGFPR